MPYLLPHTSRLMTSTVLHSVKIIFKPVVYILLLAPLVGALMSCNGANNYEEGVPESTISALLPDGEGMLFIDFSELEDFGGQLSLLDSATDKRHVLYSTNSSNDLRMRLPIWGDLSCDEPDHFSPQSFDLALRPSGRWQLLVVNHGVENLPNILRAADTVEMFELQKNELQQWELIWRGCVEIPANNFLYKVKAMDDGFILTASLTLQERIIRFAKKSIRQYVESVWRWRLQDGFQLVQIDKDAALEKTHSKE